MDTETYVPDKQYMIPGTTEHRDAFPANKHGSVGDILSGTLPNVWRRVNHEIGESYPHAETRPMEALDATITSPPYPLTDFQSVIANTVIPEKVRRNQTRSESPPTVPIHVQS